MIDAPDHAAQERDNRSTGAWLLVALLGIALSVVAGMMSYGYTTAQAEQRFADVVDYVATQSLSYDAFNSAYATKNLIRVMEIAGEAARDMERDGSVDNAMLEQYADQFYVSALIVTDASGNLVSESSTGDVGYESLATYLKEAPVMEVATHPLKSYTARITLADDSVADIGCVTRRDGEGIVIAVRHQSAKAVASNTLKLQSLLEGYETIDSGNIVIESDGKVVATNAVDGRAQIVAHATQKLCLCRVGRRGLTRRLCQLVAIVALLLQQVGHALTLGTATHHHNGGYCTAVEHQHAGDNGGDDLEVMPRRGIGVHIEFVRFSKCAQIPLAVGVNQFDLTSQASILNTVDNEDVRRRQIEYA